MKTGVIAAALMFVVAGCGDDRPCLRSHEEPTVTWVLVGKVLVPVHGTTTVCDEWGVS